MSNNSIHEEGGAWWVRFYGHTFGPYETKAIAVGEYDKMLAARNSCKTGNCED